MMNVRTLLFTHFIVFCIGGIAFFFLYCRGRLNCYSSMQIICICSLHHIYLNNHNQEVLSIEEGNGKINAFHITGIHWLLDGVYTS